MTGKGVAEPRQPLWFLLLLGLAAAGGAVAYVPFLTILLPSRIAGLAGGEDIAALSYATFAGALVASLGNIAFGWLSDRSGHRRSWILGGLALSGALLIAAGLAENVAQIVLIVMAWQLGLNMMLGPLAAWAGDCVPDAQKGLLGGLFAFAPALGALAGAAVTMPGLPRGTGQLALVAMLATAMVLPALAAGRGRKMVHLMQPVTASERPVRWRPAITGPIGRMWLARLLVQVSEAALFAFLLFWLRSLIPGFGEDRAARLFGLVLVVAVPFALLLGRWSDRHRRPMLPLALCAGCSAVGLLAMGFATTSTGAIAGYVLFGISSMSFLALHASQTLRVLPRPQNRGRDLGLFNLTNTVPSLIVPWLALALVPSLGFNALFMALALLAAISAGLIATTSRPI